MYGLGLQLEACPQNIQREAAGTIAAMRRALLEVELGASYKVKRRSRRTRGR